MNPDMLETLRERYRMANSFCRADEQQARFNDLLLELAYYVISKDRGEPEYNLHNRGNK